MLFAVLLKLRCYTSGAPLLDFGLPSLWSEKVGRADEVVVEVVVEVGGGC